MQVLEHNFTCTWDQEKRLEKSVCNMNDIAVTVEYQCCCTEHDHRYVKITLWLFD